MTWIFDEDFDDMNDNNSTYEETKKRQILENRLYDENSDVLFSPVLAEALYWFVYDECFDDFCVKNEERPLSIAEYVSEFKLPSFAKYCIDKGYISPK